MILVRPSVISGSITAPPSKSYSHRALTISLISERDSKISNLSRGRDVNATLQAIRSMGAELSGDADVRVSPPPRPEAPENVLDCGGSGTTIRFFTSIASLTERGYTVLTGNNSLRRRPMGPLLDAINKLGGWAVSTRMDGTPPLVVRGGGLQGGKVVLPGDISSQFFSSLMISGTLMGEGVHIETLGDMVSWPYVEMTAVTLGLAGASVQYNRKSIKVRPVRPQSLNFVVPGDFGLAAPIMAMASITGGEIEVKGLDLDLPQADSYIIDVLEAFGVNISLGKSSITVKGRPERPVNLNLRDAPDLLPVAAVLASFVEGRSEIKGVKHARVKESDRVAIMARELRKVCVDVIELEDGLIINGSGEVRGGKVLGPEKDHRIFMSLVALAAGSKESCRITGEECVKDSYPDFLNVVSALGLEVRY